MDGLTQRQTETAARLLADAYRLSEIARAMRVPLAVIEAWHHSYHAEPQWGDPSPEEIAERAAVLKADTLADASRRL